MGTSAARAAAACCDDIWECIIPVPWARSATTQVNLKPIIRRVIWMLRIDKGGICFVIILKYISSPGYMTL